jgi:hypothetical protein
VLGLEACSITPGPMFTFCSLIFIIFSVYYISVFQGLGKTLNREDTDLKAPVSSAIAYQHSVSVSRFFFFFVVLAFQLTFWSRAPPPARGGRGLSNEEETTKPNMPRET